MLNLREVGKRCKRFRLKNGYLQIHVAADTGYSVENVSAFETGRNDNYRILLWYLSHGMKPENLFESGEKYGADV